MTKAKDGRFQKGTVNNPHGRAGKPTEKVDTWESALAGINTIERDKRLSYTPTTNTLSYQQLIDLVEGDDLGERAVKAPINDAFRPGFEISITDEGEYDDLKADIEVRLRELDVVAVVKKALYQKRALGGSAILLGCKDYKSLATPLDRKAARGIDFLSVLEPLQLQPHTFYIDPTKPKYGQPMLWQINSTLASAAGSPTAVKTGNTEKQTREYLIHESRLIILNADKISGYTTNYNEAGQFWGLSVLVKLYEILRDFNISWHSAGLIVSDFAQGVFAIDNLMGLVARDKEGLFARLTALDMGRSVSRSILIDKEHETFERKSTNVSGLPDMLAQISWRCATAIGIPLSVLAGASQKTDAAEMSGELRYYYDNCQGIQDSEITPIMMVIIQMVIQGLRERKVPKRWRIKWHPLWQLTDEQKANARLAQARVDAIYVEHGVLDPQTVAMARFTGEYSFDTPLGPSYEAPGFMALPPMGVLVDGLDPNTGLPPGEQPDMPANGTGAKTGKSKPGDTGAHGVKSYARRNPTKKNMAKSNYSQAGGATAGSLDAADEMHCEETHKSHSELELCEHCSKCEDCLFADITDAYARGMQEAHEEIAAQLGEEPIPEPST